jgi:hypothetical protein
MKAQKSYLRKRTNLKPGALPQNPGRWIIIGPIGQRSSRP